jgi:thiol:disulfide interchange protein DsbC
MRKSARAWYLPLLVGSSLMAGACSGSEKPEIDTVLVNLKAAFPGAQIDGVKATPMKGLYEVGLAGRVMYSDATGRYLLMGPLHDMQAAPATNSSETASTEQRLDPESFGKIVSAAQRNAFKRVIGSGARQLYLFSDPKCPYCRSLEAELDKLQDVTIHTFLYPVLSQESSSIAMNVWCAKDRAAEWKKVMSGGSARGSASCAAPLQANIRMAQSLRIVGTPTLVGAEGKVLVGYQSEASIAPLLAVKGNLK